MCKNNKDVKELTLSKLFFFLFCNLFWQFYDHERVRNRVECESYVNSFLYPALSLIGWCSVFFVLWGSYTARVFDGINKSTHSA